MVGPVGADGLAITTAADGEGARVVTAPLQGAPGSSLDGAAEGVLTSILSRGTADAARAGERLADALVLARAQVAAWREFRDDTNDAFAAGGAAEADTVTPPPRALELLGVTPGVHVLRALRAIPPTDLEAVLVGLPFSDAVDVLRWTALALSRGNALELCARTATAILRVHAGRLCASAVHVPLVKATRDALSLAARNAKDVVGFNIAGLKWMERELSDAKVLPLKFGEAVAQTPRDEDAEESGAVGAVAASKKKKARKGRGDGPKLF